MLWTPPILGPSFGGRGPQILQKKFCLPFRTNSFFRETWAVTNFSKRQTLSSCEVSESRGAAPSRSPRSLVSPEGRALTPNPQDRGWVLTWPCPYVCMHRELQSLFLKGHQSHHGPPSRPTWSRVGCVDRTRDRGKADISRGCALEPRLARRVRG